MYDIKEIIEYPDETCPKCGKKGMMHIHHNSTGIMKCNHCNYGVATTEFWPIQLDETIYSLIIRKIDNISSKELNVIKKIINKSYPEIKELLSSGDYICYKGKADHIAKYLKLLKDNNISYEINPKYDYPDNQIEYASSYSYIDI